MVSKEKQIDCEKQKYPYLPVSIGRVVASYNSYRFKHLQKSIC